MNNEAAGGCAERYTGKDGKVIL